MQQLKIGEHFKKTAAMKNLFKKTMLFAAAAMAFVSCENDTTDVNTLPGVDVTINATTEGTKSHFDDYNATDKSYPTVWSGDEAWAVIVNDTKVSANAEDITFSNGNTAANATVTFSADALPEAYNGAYTLFAVSPESQYVSVNMEKDYIRFRVPASQTPSATSCDEKAQVLIAQSESAEELAGFDVTFKHAVAYGKFSFLNVAEGGNVTGVTIKNKAEDVALAGRFVYTPSTKAISKQANEEMGYEINLSTTSTTDLWFVCGPAEVQGKTLTFIINTDKGKLEKEVTMPGNFVAGKVATFKIDMAGIDYPVVEEVIQYKKVTSLAEITAGEYVIVEKTKVLPNTAVSKNPAQIELSTKATVDTDVLTNVDDGVKWIFTGTASAMKVQSYANNANYLHNNSSNTGVTINGTNNKTWTIEAYNKGFSMKCNSRYLGIYEDGSDWRSYTAVNAGNYGSDGACLTLYKKVDGNTGGDTPDVPETPAPELTITTTAPIEVVAGGDVATVKYTITNPVDGQSVTASANQTWVNNFDYTVAGEVSFIVDENTGAAREATVTLSYDGATAQTIKISQAAAQQGGGDEPEQPTGGTHFVKVTSAPSDWSGTYLIVYEGGNLALNGSLSKLDGAGNYTSVSISNNEIEATDAMKAIAFTVEKSGDTYTVKSASGLYMGATSNSNSLLSNASTKYTNSISFKSASEIDIKGSGGAFLRYNASDKRFRYYKSTSYTSQQAIQLYKLN